MKVIYETYYVDWCDRFNERIFDDPGIGNYTCAIMAGPISFLEKKEIGPEIKISESKLNVVEKTVVSQLTRKEKRKNKAKQLKI